MEIREFELERIQSLYENRVEYNLSDSGVHPYNLRELLTATEREALLEVELGYGWTNGSVELRRSIAALYEGRDGDNVIVTNGSAEANFLLVMTLLQPGDEIIVFVPNYLQIWGWAKAIGVEVKEVALRAELGWQPDLDELRAALSSRTKMITVCTPNNPTGSLLTDETQAALVAIAAEADITLHADEVYKGAELDGRERRSFADLYDKAIVTNGLSKAMALPGLRIGWLVGQVDEIYGAWQRKDYTSITTSAVSEFVADIVLQPARRAEILERSRRILRANVELLSGWIDANADLFSCVLPQAGGMAFLRYNMPVNSSELVTRMRLERSILLLPGDVYGLDGHIRIGVGAPAGHLEAGLARLAEFVRAEIV